jgi:hypothetical protein
MARALKADQFRKGQSRPNEAVRATSAFPPIATELRTFEIGSFVPTAEVTLASAWSDRKRTRTH